MVWESTFTTLGELPWVLLFLSCTCVYCVMGAMPMAHMGYIPKSHELAHISLILFIIIFIFISNNFYFYLLEDYCLMYFL